MDETDLHAQADEVIADIMRDFNLTREEAAAVLLDMLTYHLDNTEE